MLKCSHISTICRSQPQLSLVRVEGKVKSCYILLGDEKELIRGLELRWSVTKAQLGKDDAAVWEQRRSTAPIRTWC